MSTVVAFCWANGIIDVGPVLLEGALPIAVGNGPQIKKALDTLSTHSYDGVTRLVPKSVAWCEGDMDAAVDDVVNFSIRIKNFLDK